MLPVHVTNLMLPEASLLPPSLPQPGDPSSFPDFATPALGDDELEVTLLQRPAAARGVATSGAGGGVGYRANGGPPPRPASAPAAAAVAAQDGPARSTGPQGAAAIAVEASPLEAASGAGLRHGGSGDNGDSGMSWDVDEEEAMELLGPGQAAGLSAGGGSGKEQAQLQLAPRPTAMRRRQRPAQQQQVQQQEQ